LERSLNTSDHCSLSHAHVVPLKSVMVDKSDVIASPFLYMDVLITVGMYVKHKRQQLFVKIYCN